jgi:thymidylate synthase
MNTLDAQYLNLCKEILKRGFKKENRTGISAYTIPSAYIKHDMSEGFPILTSRFIPFKSVRVELEFFIKGLTDKTWLQERGCHYWDEWCNPKKIPYSTDPLIQEHMRQESDLGKVYGYQWRNYNDSGIDQLKNIVETIKRNPNDRRMLCIAWNPQQIGEMALPPCHFGFQVTVIDDAINLSWMQRSCDLALGISSNIASYGLLLHLLSLQTGLRAGELCGHLNDVHIYENHINGLNTQLEQEIFALPAIKTIDFRNIFNWQYTQTSLENYKYSPKIEFPIAV